MKARLKSKLAACVWVLILALLGVVIGADVIVQNGHLTVDDDLVVEDEAQVYDRLYAGGVTAYANSQVIGYFYVDSYVNADCYLEHSSFYDKDAYGRALDYSQDSSNTIKVNAQGEKEYDHEADPVFLQKWVTVTDYQKYTDEQVWNAELNQYETVRVYETREELTSDLGMKVAWLRQCVFELKQENEMLKAELAQLKAVVSVE
jgi:hypothetical protein